jgi:large subunit ribosomal protein L2
MENRLIFYLNKPFNKMNMNLSNLKATSNSKRNTVLLSKSLLIKNVKIFKKLKVKIKKAYGRSKVNGQITSWHRQQGYKKLYRNVVEDEKKCNFITIGTSYDPNRNAFVSISFDLERKKFFTSISTKNIYSGALIVKNNNLAELKSGYRFSMDNIPIGTEISNITLGKSKKSSYAKSAGTFCKLIEKNNNKALIQLPSGKKQTIPILSFANIGIVSNEKFKNIIIGKAGRNRNLGKRPIVRGIAMNPVDHPHGGRTNGGKPSVTPWGLPTKNKFRLKRRKHKNKVCQDQNGKDRI